MDEHRKSRLLIKNSGGRTMIEVLIAMAIFTIGFLAVGTMVLSTVHNNTAGNILTQATMLARERIEFLKTLPVRQMEKQCSDGLQTEYLDGIFKRVCDVEPGFSDTVKVLKVTVSWHRRGRVREVVLKTLTRGDGT